ncbi:hypothetical protein PPACK8108_LOCUS5061 [Phakopsora pachyrhizi]|uniref:Proteasome inhibitor PI31 subunit n=1 Tax=Phakopsora pachyrhizi TaxID=170000 RepID=A0AAV0AN69_PHAPC|nr:hypothetical protein PPACK8108_LOCUS5061 [Phakopsora pachyrhizi]
MTQIETDQSVSSEPKLSNSQFRKLPSELQSIYQSFPRILQQSTRRNSNDSTSKVHEPSSLIYLICHTILINNSFRVRRNRLEDTDDLGDDGLGIELDEFLQLNSQNFHPKYSHNQSSLTFEFNFSKIGNRVSICALASENDQLSNLDLSISEYLDETKFPILLKKSESYDSVGFRSSSHLLNLVSIFVNKILHNLLPDLIPTISIEPSSNSSSPSNHPPPNPTADNRPGYRNSQPVHTITSNQNSFRNPLEIGRSDLDPIGTSNIVLPSIYNRPSNIFPSHQIDQPTGMMVGPNHPIFNDRNPSRPSDIFGGDGFLPPGAVPPGARFDPIGPGSTRFDPMGGLSQGLPIRNYHPGRNNPGGAFNECKPAYLNP